jgi:general secretion pathway protein D
MIGDALITSDPETRRIIVITDEQTQANISQVISNLDKPKPQVLIKVVFAEVTYNNSLDIGVEGSYHRNIGGQVLGALTTNFFVTNGVVTPKSITPTLVPGSQSVTAGSSFGLAQQLATSSSGLGFAQIMGNDYTVTLKALAQNGKVDILSRPTILARNNQKASIVVGQEVPLITGVNYDTLGAQHNSITYQNVGIILDVTPFITQDGMVEMILKPQISAVNHDPSQQVAVASSTTNGTTSATYAPVIDVRAADTVVVTPDGNTVVIGGLMQNQKSSSISKVPLLGDIPLLGQLFRHKVDSDTKTELLIFLTPYVVKTPHDLAMMTTSETSRSQLVPRDFSERELNQFLDNAVLKHRDDDPRKKRSHSTSTTTTTTTTTSSSPKNQ